VRRRLALAIVGVASAAIVLFAVPLALVLRSSYRDAELARLQRDTIAATREIDVSAPGRDAIELPSTRDRLAVYDARGRRLAGSGPPVADALVRGAQRSGRAQQHAGSGQLAVAVALLKNEHLSGIVRATRSDAVVESRSRRAWLRLAVAAAALIAVAALAAAWLGRRLARPLERLAGSARRLGDGDFSARAPASGVPELDGVATALDITAQRLDELLNRERAFSADASHQLRTPLAALRIELEAMQLRALDAPELPAALAQVDRLQATIDTLLNAARDIRPADARSDLRALLDEAEPRWRAALAAGSRPVRTLVRAGAPVAAASPAVVAEVLEVLVSNARIHGAGAVTVVVRDAPGGIAIDVSDEGPGLTGRSEEVFERRSDSDGGHGIGLALARSLAHSEGGRLSVTDAGPMPVFTLFLRIADG
jgi:signal transduction histidine kinase